MDPNGPSKKSDSKSGTPDETSAKKKTMRPSSNSTINGADAGPNQQKVVQKDQDLAPVLAELPTTPTRFDTDMKNQISSSRGITVEIDTLKDLMPKLRKEIQTYSINECQIVKELEKKLPSCQEHGDVRFNLSLDEIHRLRLNRRKTLAKLKESIVKVVELQSRMEVASYEAGELFWDRRISTIANSKYQSLDLLTILDEESSVDEGSRSSSSSDSRDPTMAPTSTSIPPAESTKYDQGLLTELAKEIKENYIRDIEPEKTKEFVKESPMFSSVSGPVENARLALDNNIADKAGIGNKMDVSGSPEQPTPNNPLDITGATLTQDGMIDFEKAITEAQKKQSGASRSLKRGIAIVVIPLGIAIALFTIESLTGIFSKMFGGLFG